MKTKPCLKCQASFVVEKATQIYCRACQEEITKQTQPKPTKLHNHNKHAPESI